MKKLRIVLLFIMAARKTKRQIEADKKNSTRDLMTELPEFCARHGYVMPAEFLIAVMNGDDPRKGGDLSDDILAGVITVDHSVAAAKTLCKYLYATASKVEIDGSLNSKTFPSNFHFTTDFPKVGRCMKG